MVSQTKRGINGDSLNERVQALNSRWAKEPKALSTSLATPSQRMVLVQVWGGGYEVYPIVGIVASLCEGDSYPELAAVYVNEVGELTLADHRYQAELPCGELAELVVCTWPIEDDAERLQPKIDELTEAALSMWEVSA